MEGVEGWGDAWGRVEGVVWGGGMGRVGVEAWGRVEGVGGVGWRGGVEVEASLATYGDLAQDVKRETMT